MKNRRRYIPVGSFELTQRKMVVSDPAYDLDTWCMEVVNNCRVGTWYADINVNHYSYTIDGRKCTDERTAALFVRHSSASKETYGTIHCEQRDQDVVIRFRTGWENLSNNIGVDSGQAGFFDFAKYKKNSQFKSDGKCGFGDKWYSNCCDATMTDFAGIIANCGVNASSGFGDGSYCLWGHKDAAGEIDAMVLFFLADNEEVNEGGS